MKGKTGSSAPKAPPFAAPAPGPSAEPMEPKGKFKRGGAVAIEGSKSTRRLDRGGKSPFSATHNLTQGGSHKAS